MLAEGHTFIVLNLQPLGEDVRTGTMDGPEVKFRFGRHVEAVSGQKIFNVLP